MRDEEKTIDQLRWALESQAVAVRILAVLNQRIGRVDAIREILGLVKEFTGFEAVAIRLRDGEDYPYFVTRGFPDHFVEAENYLCAHDRTGETIRDSAGVPVLECMCGNIIRGRTDPSFPFFTEGGTFWTNSTSQLLTSSTEDDRQARTRNRCHGEGYESVALIPLRSERETIGLLQLNDSREDCFTPEMILFFEGIGASIGIVLTRASMEEELRKAHEGLERRVEERTAALLKANEQLKQEISERRKATEALNRIEWLLQAKSPSLDSYVQPYGNLVQLNTSRVLLDAVGENVLSDIAGDSLDLLDTSGAIYEKNGDYALGIFASGWCQFLDQASYGLCGTKDPKEALESGCWHCHESCWTKASKVSIETGQLVDIECDGGIHLCAVPIWAGDEVAGSINIGYGDPPEDLDKLREIADRYGVNLNELCQIAASYQSRPPFIIDIAKKRLESAARLIGALLDRKKAEDALGKARDELERRVEERTGELAEANEMLKHEIFDRKKAEEEISRSRLLLETIVQNLPIQIFVKDAQELKFVLVNRACEALTGYPAKELLGRSDYYFFPRDQADFFTSKDRETLAKGILVDIPEEVLETKSAGAKILHTKKVPILDESGKPEFLLGISEDITDRKKLEEQFREAQKMEAIGTLAGGIAHDFNNLLQIVLGHAELLMMDADKKTSGYEELHAIRSAADRGADLVRRILTFSRKVDSKIQPVKLNEEVEQAERLLYRTVPKMIEIQTRLADDLKIVNADRSQIEQMLVNLALNAKDAMPEGGTLVFETENVILDENFCKTHVELQPGVYVRLTVSDTGHGMEKDVLDHVFEPFFTTKRPDKGTGLGLSMVFGIVKMHGGHITCESEPGEGTTFRIYLPAAEVKIASEDAPELPIPVGGTETILVVDDEELIAELAKKILSRSGYNVLTACSGREALEVYKRERANISLVILDLIMPEMGGKQCLEELLKIDAQVKALIASGFATDGEAKTFLEAAAKGTVSKPFNTRELLQSIRNVLDGV